MGILESNTNANFNLSSHLKISLLIIVFSFFAYSLYWTLYSVYWVYNITVNITATLQMQNIISPLQQTIIIIQEYAASVGYFFAFVGSIFAVQCAVLFIKNEEHIDRLAKTLLFEALFFVMLIPSSIQHLLGVIFSWPLVDIYVGLSFMLQALLIAPPLIILSYNLRKTRHHTSVRKWVAIGAPLVVFGFWIKYLFLFLYALSPLGPNSVNLTSIFVTANSFVMLIAGITTSIACLVLYQKRRVHTRLVGLALVLFGSYFVIYDLISIWVPVYRSFLYLTDFWMIVLPILGVAVATLVGDDGDFLKNF